jgi:hypothetical protein
MNSMKIRFTYGVLAAVMFSGCYTQFATLDYAEPPRETIVAEIDSSSGDTIQTKVVTEKDTVTIIEKERELCYWTYDIWGEPVLRCAESYFAQDWFRYYNSPWWYRSSYGYGQGYDYGRCPTYYYYDPGCGCCRHFQDRSYYPYYSGGGSGSGGSAPAQHPARRRSLSGGEASPGPSSGAAASSSPASSLPKSSTSSGGGAGASAPPKASPPETRAKRRSLGGEPAASEEKPSPEPSPDTPGKENPALQSVDETENRPSSFSDSTAGQEEPERLERARRRSF